MISSSSRRPLPSWLGLDKKFAAPKMFLDSDSYLLGYLSLGSGGLLEGRF